MLRGTVSLMIESFMVLSPWPECSFDRFNAFVALGAESVAPSRPGPLKGFFLLFWNYWFCITWLTAVECGWRRLLKLAPLCWLFRWDSMGSLP